MLHLQTTSAWLKHTSLRFEPVPRAQLIMYHRFHSLTRFVLSPQLQAVYDFCCPLEQVSPLVSDRMALPNQFMPMPCAPLAVSSPPRGGTRLQKKKKKSGGMFVHQDFFGLPLRNAPRRVSRRVLAPFSTVPYSLRCCSMLPKKKKKEGLHTRAANATPPLRRQWSSLMLLSRGALPAVRDVLMTAVSAFGRFFA